MDSLDRSILDIIQTAYPIVSRPYAAIGDQIGLTEAETLARIRRMQQLGIIRRLGANFQSRKLGWKSTLCAASVPQDQLRSFIEVVNEYPGVTHNYLRRHTYNVWFTFIGPSWDRISEDLATIRRRTGIDVLNLPAEAVFKIQVNFQMNDNEDELAENRDPCAGNGSD
jgi:DNA-binding Lrp family transcriptional regulator